MGVANQTVELPPPRYRSVLVLNCISFRRRYSCISGHGRAEAFKSFASTSNTSVKSVDKKPEKEPLSDDDVPDLVSESDSE